MKGVPEAMAGLARVNLNEYGIGDATSSVDGETGTTLTPSASMDEISTLFEADPRYGTTTTAFHVTYRDCKPLNIFRSLKVNEGAFFPLHFENCQVGSVDFRNCIMLNVTFENCKFGGGTIWTNIFLKDVTFVDCVFVNHTWFNGREEEETITARKRIGKPDLGEEVPWEITNPDFLENEADGTNETRRKFESEAVDFNTAPRSTAEPDLTEKEIREWNEAKAKEWEAKGREDWHIAELEASLKSSCLEQGHRMLALLDKRAKESLDRQVTLLG